MPVAYELGGGSKMLKKTMQVLLFVVAVAVTTIRRNA
jgi:hypothetical protein